MVSTEDFERVREERDTYKRMAADLTETLRLVNVNGSVTVHPVRTPSYTVYGSAADLKALYDHVGQAYQDGFEDACRAGTQ